jgi:AraC-like DNA-binding protein
VLQSLDVIECRISEKLTVENIAGAVFFSKYHYQRLFREIVGSSVMEYVTKRKLTLAGRALLESNASIIDIALAYGYDSREGFTRSFKSYMGVTPNEYRKYGLTAISQNTVKECNNMVYTKSTDAIIRELNEWIAKAKDLASQVQKSGEGELKPFWDSVAEHTDAFADSVNKQLYLINNISRNPDEINNALTGVKLLDDIIFQMHSLAFQIAISEARMEAETNFSEKYRELALLGQQKVLKVFKLLRKLTTLIIEDMRKTASDKMRNAIEKGKKVAESLPDNANYIKDEVLRLIAEMETTPVESMSELMLSDLLFKLEIITITVKLNVFPAPDTMIGSMEAFNISLQEAVEFCRSIVKQNEDEPEARKIGRILQDCAFQGNVLLFYTRGEIEYLCTDNELEDNRTNEERKAALDKIETKIDRYIHLAHSAERGAEMSVFKMISDIAHELVNELNEESKILGKKGGALKVLADEHEKLTAKASEYIKEAEHILDSNHKC